MITDEQYEVWLQNDVGDPVVLIEAEYIDDQGDPGTAYVSDRVYPGPGGPESPQIYDEIVNGDITIESRFDRLTIGSVDLINDGSITEYLDRVWRGQHLRFYLGDQSWDRTDFRLQLEAINCGIRASRSNRFVWTMCDLAETLNTDVGSETSPICLGKCFNVAPVLIDAATKKYKVHTGAVTSITVRDNGLSAASTIDLANGEFTLTNASAGQVTCDVVQSDQSAAAIITNLCGQKSIAVNSTNLAAFANTDTLGVYIDRPTILETLIRTVMASVGGSYRFNELKQLEMWRLEAPMSGEFSLIADDIQDQGSQEQSVEYPFTKLTLGYKRNWGLQSADSLATTVTTQLRDDYSTEYQTVSASNVLTDYPTKEERRDTLFFDEADAQAECDRRAVLRALKRTTHRIKAYMTSPELLEGKSLSITYPYLGFESSEDVVAIGLRRRLGKRRVELLTWS